MSKELESLYTPLQSLNNIRYNYFHDKGGSELEYFWFNRVETALKNQKRKLDLISEVLVDVSKGNYADLNDTISKIREVLEDA